MRSRACGCSGSKLCSDCTPLPSLDRTTSSSFCPTALPFIVGPHQCSLTNGPDGRPQVEVVLRVRLPLAEFFDALLLSLADQRPLFQQVGHEPTPASTAPLKAGLQTTGHRSPPLKEEASPKRKTTGRTQPKRRGLRTLPSMLQQLTLLMKSWRYSRMPHGSLTRLR